MRQSQQKNRMRGRGRKGPSPLSRSFESNGPDVKIRGTAAHIAEKYASLARDALSMGDNVMAENYLQHAEHYNRIVAAATPPASRGEEGAASFGRGPQPDVSGDSDAEDDGERGSAEARTPRNPQPAKEAAGDEGDETRADNRADNTEQRQRPEGRKSRRPRRTEAAEGSNGNGAAAESESGNGAERPKRAGISSDASMLPDSILGAPSKASEEKAGAED